MIIDDSLYMKDIVQSLLKCITHVEGKGILHKVHRGFCGC